MTALRILATACALVAVWHLGQQAPLAAGGFAALVLFLLWEQPSRTRRS